MADLLPVVHKHSEVWSPLAQRIHKVVWDQVGLGTVQGHVQQWAKVYELVPSRQAVLPCQHHGYDYEPHFPPLPLPPEHRSCSMEEKWASLAAIHDVYWKGDKINPWPLPLNREELGSFVEWGRWLAKGGEVFRRLMERAARLADAHSPYIGRWLEDLQTQPSSTRGVSAEVERIAEVVDEGLLAIVRIASGKSQSAEDRMKLIVAEDRRFLSKTSPEWATLLQVTSPAIRKMGFWALIQSNPDKAYLAALEFSRQ